MSCTTCSCPGPDLPVPTPYLLAKGGYKVGLIEREQLPRSKCCAGGAMQRALGLLDFQIPGDIIERRVTGANVVLEDRVHTIDVGRTVISTVRRSRFDSFLATQAEKAGAEVLQEQIGERQGAGRSHRGGRRRQCPAGPGTLSSRKVRPASNASRLIWTLSG